MNLPTFHRDLLDSSQDLRAYFTTHVEAARRSILGRKDQPLPVEGHSCLAWTWEIITLPFKAILMIVTFIAEYFLYFLCMTTWSWQLHVWNYRLFNSFQRLDLWTQHSLLVETCQVLSPSATDIYLCPWAPIEGLNAKDLINSEHPSQVKFRYSGVCNGACNWHLLLYQKYKEQFPSELAALIAISQEFENAPPSPAALLQFISYNGMHSFEKNDYMAVLDLAQSNGKVLKELAPGGYVASAAGHRINLYVLESGEFCLFDVNIGLIRYQTAEECSNRLETYIRRFFVSGARAGYNTIRIRQIPTTPLLDHLAKA